MKIKILFCLILKILCFVASPSEGIEQFAEFPALLAQTGECHSRDMDLYFDQERNEGRYALWDSIERSILHGYFSNSGVHKPRVIKHYRKRERPCLGFLAWFGEGECRELIMGDDWLSVYTGDRFEELYNIEDWRIMRPLVLGNENPMEAVLVRGRSAEYLDVLVFQDYRRRILEVEWETNIVGGAIWSGDVVFAGFSQGSDGAGEHVVHWWHLVEDDNLLQLERSERFPELTIPDDLYVMSVELIESAENNKAVLIYSTNDIHLAVLSEGGWMKRSLVNKEVYDVGLIAQIRQPNVVSARDGVYIVYSGASGMYLQSWNNSFEEYKEYLLNRNGAASQVKIEIGQDDSVITMSQEGSGAILHPFDWLVDIFIRRWSLDEMNPIRKGIWNDLPLSRTRERSAVGAMPEEWVTVYLPGKELRDEEEACNRFLEIESRWDDISYGERLEALPPHLDYHLNIEALNREEVETIWALLDRCDNWRTRARLLTILRFSDDEGGNIANLEKLISDFLDLTGVSWGDAVVATIAFINLREVVNSVDSELGERLLKFWRDPPKEFNEVLIRDATAAIRDAIDQ